MRILSVLLTITVGVMLSACQTSGLTSEDDPNRVNLNSYDVATSHPATAVDWKNKPIMIDGKMSYPQGEGPFPAIVYLLSSGGYNAPYDDKWVKQLNDAGYATLMVNQYSARGMKLVGGLGTKQSGMSDVSFLHDVYAAVGELRNNPRIDGDRIATFGMSWGGGIQMYMMADWYTQNAGDGVEIKAHVALSPACYMTIDQPKATSGSLLMLLGEKDNWNEPGPCKDYAAKLQKSGGDVKVVDIKGGQHGWDMTKPAKSKTVTVYHCQITYDPDTKMGYNHREGKEVDYSTSDWGNLWDDCQKQATVTTGGTAEQRAETEAAVFEFLKEKL